MFGLFLVFFFLTDYEYKDKGFTISGAVGSRKFRTEFLQELPTPGTGPYFDTSVPNNLTGLVGKTAYLNCRVKNLGNRTNDENRQVELIGPKIGKAITACIGEMARGQELLNSSRSPIIYGFIPQDRSCRGRQISKRLQPKIRALTAVSWVRHRDIHLLTVGRYTYTSDQRFEAIHSPHTEDWTLRIRYPQRKDSGIYECQISTTPPIGHPVYLTVVEPITEIIGGPDLFINVGSTINLTCLVRYAPEPPPSIVWSHDKKIISFDSPRGGISLVTEKGLVTTSRLLIQKAIPEDTGLYTCDPSNANSANVRVHILNGEHPAAMQRGIAIAMSCPTLLSALAAPTGVLLHMNKF